MQEHQQEISHLLSSGKFLNAQLEQATMVGRYTLIEEMTNIGFEQMFGKQAEGRDE